jgi:hypothetical protein
MAVIIARSLSGSEVGNRELNRVVKRPSLSPDSSWSDSASWNRYYDQFSCKLSYEFDDVPR